LQGEARADRLSRLVALGGLLVFVAGLCLGPMAESDLFFRIEAGRQIFARRGLPDVNLYSFTFPDFPDLDTSWLFEVGVAALHARGGFTAVVLAKTAVIVGAFAGAFAVCVRRGAGAAASAAALASAAYVGRERFVERPHVFSLLGIVLVLAVSDALVTPAPDARATRRIILAALAGVVVWANLHAGVFLAPSMLALSAAGARLDGRPGAGRLAWLAAAAAFATLATPVGLRLLTYLRLHTILPALHPIDEFRSATWISDAPLFVYLAAVASSCWATRSRGALLPLVAMAALALRSARFAADFALYAAPFVAAALSRLGERVRRLEGRGAGDARAGAWGTAAALAVLAVAPRVQAARAGRPPIAVGLDEGALPLDAIRFVEENGLRERMYNDFETGSYLLFEGFPRYRVFVDPRLPAYPPELHALLGRGDLTRAEWDGAMNRFGVDSALLAYAGLNRRVAWWDPDVWALVYRAQDARVFVRRAPRWRSFIAAREIPATFTFTAAEGAVTVPLVQQPASSPVAACEWDRRLGELLFELEGPRSTAARAAYQRALAVPGCLAPADERRLSAFSGAVALAEGRAGDAAARLERALALGDDDITTRVNLALALERAGRAREAAAAWADVATRATDPALVAKARARAAR
jgi:hypothetical protein